jgi:hypothetical protein
VDGENRGEAENDDGEMIVKGNEVLIVITATAEDSAHARAMAAVAGDAMMMRTRAEVHMSFRREIGMSGSAKSELRERVAGCW